MRLQVDKPKPMPFDLVVNNGVQSLLSVCFEIPVPVSAKESDTLSSAATHPGCPKLCIALHEAYSLFKTRFIPW
jgi:hypothetical protein